MKFFEGLLTVLNAQLSSGNFRNECLKATLGKWSTKEAAASSTITQQILHNHIGMAMTERLP